MPAGGISVAADDTRVLCLLHTFSVLGFSFPGNCPEELRVTLKCAEVDIQWGELRTMGNENP